MAWFYDLVVFRGDVHEGVGVDNGVVLGEVRLVVEDEEAAEVDGVDDLDVLVVGVLAEEHLLEAVLDQLAVQLSTLPYA